MPITGPAKHDRALWLVREWLNEHRDELEGNWDRAQPRGTGIRRAVDMNSRDLFEQVRVNPETQTVEWPGEVDLDPDVLYGRYEPASLVRIDRRTVREPKSAAHA